MIKMRKLCPINNSAKSSPVDMCVANLQLSSKTFVRDEYLTNKHPSLYNLSSHCVETDSVGVQTLHLKNGRLIPFHNGYTKISLNKARSLLT
jgi:hypothetical protein